MFLLCKLTSGFRYSCYRRNRMSTGCAILELELGCKKLIYGTELISNVSLLNRILDIECLQKPRTIQVFFPMDLYALTHNHKTWRAYIKLELMEKSTWIKRWTIKNTDMTLTSDFDFGLQVKCENCLYAFACFMYALGIAWLWNVFLSNIDSPSFLRRCNEWY